MSTTEALPTVRRLTEEMQPPQGMDEQGLQIIIDSVDSVVGTARGQLEEGTQMWDKAFEVQEAAFNAFKKDYEDSREITSKLDERLRESAALLQDEIEEKRAISDAIEENDATLKLKNDMTREEELKNELLVEESSELVEKIHIREQAALLNKAWLDSDSAQDVDQINQKIEFITEQVPADAQKNYELNGYKYTLMHDLFESTALLGTLRKGCLQLGAVETQLRAQALACDERIEQLRITIEQIASEIAALRKSNTAGQKPEAHPEPQLDPTKTGFSEQTTEVVKPMPAPRRFQIDALPLPDKHLKKGSVFGARVIVKAVTSNNGSY